jgi:hypothetical protein
MRGALRSHKFAAYSDFSHILTRVRWEISWVSAQDQNKKKRLNGKNHLTNPDENTKDAIKLLTICLCSF